MPEYRRTAVGPAPDPASRLHRGEWTAPPRRRGRARPRRSRPARRAPPSPGRGTLRRPPGTCAPARRRPEDPLRHRRSAARRPDPRSAAFVAGPQARSRARWRRRPFSPAERAGCGRFRRRPPASGSDSAWRDLAPCGRKKQIGETRWKAATAAAAPAAGGSSSCASLSGGSAHPASAPARAAGRHRLRSAASPPPRG